MAKKSTSLVVFAALLLAVPSAYAATIQTLTFDQAPFVHGSVVGRGAGDPVVSTIYDTGAYGNVTIFADNNGGGPNIAVAFDTDTPTNDPDLGSPFYSSPADLAAEQNNPFVPGPNPFYPDKVLILQENGSGCGDGVCNSPDDEGSRPAGILTFKFGSVIELLSMDFFDIETAEDGATPNNRIRLYTDTDGNNEVLANTFYTPDTGGDRLWDQVVFDSSVNPELASLRRIDVYMGGSGALDNLQYKVVPVPASVWLFGSALLGFIGYSRRRMI